MELLFRNNRVFWFVGFLTLVQFHDSDHFSTFSHMKNSPRFVSPVINATVAQGRNGRLSCSIENLNHYKVAWIYKSPEGRAVLTAGFQTITKNPRISVAQEGSAWVLFIHQVIKKDQGTYLCQVNTRPPTSQFGYLSVVVSPVINDATSSNDVSIDEGHDITLTCDAKGDPDPDIKWIREDGTAISTSSSRAGMDNIGKTLTIFQATRDVAGAYLCIATNGVPPAVSKRMILAIDFAPKINVESVGGSSYGVVIGTDLTLTCDYNSRPKGTVKWFRGSQEIVAKPPFVTITLRHGSTSIAWISTVSLRLLHQTDFGSFHCRVKNRLGEDRITYNVYEVTTTSTTTISSTTMELTTRKVYPTLNKPKYNNEFGNGNHGSQPPYYIPHWFTTNETSTNRNKNRFIQDENNSISDRRKNSLNNPDLPIDSLFGSSMSHGKSLLNPGNMCLLITMISQLRLLDYQ